MTEIPKSHPRYDSLMTREKITKGVENGLTSPHGLIAQGRGEAFDYLIGEQTMASARHAQTAAAALLLLAEKPVISINGNAAALAPSELVTLAQLTGAQLEVNLFHRTEERVSKIVAELKKHGADVVLGENAEPLLPLDHDRSKVERNGIYCADVVFVPLEDGDRCEALANMKKLVIAVDLNPLSRTAGTAHITIVDNLTRAAANMIALIPDLKNMAEDELWDIIDGYDNSVVLIDAIEEMKEHLIQKQNELIGPEKEPDIDPKVAAAMEKRAEVAKRVMMRGADLMME
jgi:4-phosphopantoate--beta-alanine ligase